jgi:hypothetical protein
VRALAKVIGLGGLLACASTRPQPQRLPDGSYEIRCREKLAACLTAIDGVCEWHGYDVVRATEKRKRSDIRDIRDETITSEAIVRCRDGDPLFGGKPTPPPPPPPPPPAPAVVVDAGQPPDGG